MRMGDNVEGQRPQHSKDPDVRERGGREEGHAGIKWCGEKQAEITS